MLAYPVRLVPTETSTVRVMFPDVPEAVAEGNTEAEALENAKIALELALGDRLHSHREIPAPSDICGAPEVGTDKYLLRPAPKAAKAPISGGRR